MTTTPPVELTVHQRRTVERFAAFLDGPAPVFILRGSAGTGKTTLIRSFIGLLTERNRRYAALAPTGRAARILKSKTRCEAGTIHGSIYAMGSLEVFEQAQSANDPGLRMHFPLRQDDPGDIVFMVDEASMVGDSESKEDLLRYGSGRLLADLIQYLRMGRVGRDDKRGAKLVFVGDPAQLPPIIEKLSPALSADYLTRTFDLECVQDELTEVMRQASGSAILKRATKLRDSISRGEFNTLDLAAEGDEITAVSIPDAIAKVVEAERTKSRIVLITHTNAQALDLNRAVRGQLWGAEDAPLTVRDLLLVNKNSPSTGLLNGDLVKVVSVVGLPEIRLVGIRGEPEPVRLAFQEVVVAYRDADGQVVRVAARILNNLLDSRERDLTPVQQRALLVNFRQGHPHLKPASAEFRMELHRCPYFNALQVKYGYALTCHKAQGGEWDTAIVNFSDSRGKDNEEYFRWAYTAITRAKSSLLTIDAPSFDATSAIRWGAETPASSPAPPGAANPQDLIDATLPTDPDWTKYAFRRDLLPLFAYHLALREAWARASIEIERLDHLQWRERYLLSRDGKHAAVEYLYKGTYTASTTSAAPGPPADPQLLDDALAAMTAALKSSAKGSSPPTDPFLMQFQKKVEASLIGSSIRLINVESMPYRLRMEFSENSRHCKIDFVYNGKKRWTGADEVGGAGSSQGLIERLRAALGSGV